MKSKTILGADGATKMRQITVGIHGKGGEAGIKAIQQLAGMVDSLKQCQTPQEVYDRYLQITGYERTALRRELPQAERNRRYAGRTDRRGKDQKIAGYGAAAYLQPLAALIAGGNWNNGANCGARAVNCNNYPWNVNTNIGARGACDLVRTLQAQSSTEYWQGLRKG